MPSINDWACPNFHETADIDLKNQDPDKKGVFPGFILVLKITGRTYECDGDSPDWACTPRTNKSKRVALACWS